MGLTSKRYQSGEVDKSGRVSKCGDSLMRIHLYEAANVTPTRLRKWSSLKDWGVKLAKRIGAEKAEVAMARKLAVILHCMWVNGTDFMWPAPLVFGKKGLILP